MSSQYRKQLEACWLGKNIGGILGTPLEGYPFSHDLTYFDPVPDEPLPNDDLELQVMYAAALDQETHPVINGLHLGEIWQKHGSSTFFGTSKVKQQKKLEMKLKKTGIAPIFESSQTKIGGYDAGQSLLYPKDSWISTAKCKIYVKQCIFFIETD